MDASLAQRLDRLETRGRGYLSGVARRRAVESARDMAAYSLLGVGIVALCLRLVLPIQAPTVAVLAGIAVLVATGAVFLLKRRGDPSRTQALALFDDRLGLKDRLVVSDEFLSTTGRDGFRGAALAEASPWVDRALDTRLEIDHAATPAPAVRRRWRLVAGGAALLLLALLISRPLFSGANGSASTGRDRGANFERPADRDRAARDPAVRDGAGKAANGAPSPPIRIPPGGAAQPGRAAMAGSAAQAGRPGGDAAGRASGAVDADARSEASAQAKTGATAGQGEAAGGAATANLSDRQLDGTSGADPVQADAERARMAAGDAAAAKASPPTPPSRLPRSRNGASAPDSARPESRQGDGDQQGRADGGNRSGTGSGRGSNRDGIKRSRGIGSLLLAVPMEDRFIGTPNAGPVQSTNRRAERSDQSPAGQVQAGERGARTGDSGRIVRGPVTLHEQRLIRDYFNRGARQ